MNTLSRRRFLLCSGTVPIITIPATGLASRTGKAVPAADGACSIQRGVARLDGLPPIVAHSVWRAMVDRAVGLHWAVPELDLLARAGEMQWIQIASDALDPRAAVTQRLAHALRGWHASRLVAIVIEGADVHDRDLGALTVELERDCQVLLTTMGRRPGGSSLTVTALAAREP